MKALHIIDRVDRRLGGAMQAVLAVCKYLTGTSSVKVQCAASVGTGDDLDHLDSSFPEVTMPLFRRDGVLARYADSSEFEKWLTKLSDSAFGQTG